MDCFCGCGRKLRSRQIEVNLQASRMALELLAWDKARAGGQLGIPAADDAERVMARGADCYQRLLGKLHGEPVEYSFKEGEAWLKDSEEERRDREYMTERGGFLKRDKLLLTDEDRSRLDRLRPELSFTGGDGTAGGAAPDPSRDVAAPAADTDVAGQLERLGALRAEGVLSDEEFAAAKSRVLRR